MGQQACGLTSSAAWYAMTSTLGLRDLGVRKRQGHADARQRAHCSCGTDALLLDNSCTCRPQNASDAFSNPLVRPCKPRRQALRREAVDPVSRASTRTRRVLEACEQHVCADGLVGPQHHAVVLLACDTRGHAAGQPLPCRVAPGAHGDDHHVSREGVGPALDEHACERKARVRGWHGGEGYRG